MKRKIAILLAFVMLFTSFGGALPTETVFAASFEETEEVVQKTGLMQLECEVLPPEMAKDAYDYVELSSVDTYALIYDDEWDKYGTNFCYNQLSQEYKDLWDALDLVCLSYLNSDKSITDARNYLELVTVPENKSVDEIKNFAYMFLFSNPQYYFLRSALAWSTNWDGTVDAMCFKAYEAFVDGESRREATEAMQAQIDTWVSEVEAYATEEEKVEKIHELICYKVDYNYDYIDGLVTEEEAFTQSPYSVFCMDLTVCAGYADAMALMCNAVGIDAICVTSEDHEWNRVKINDSWYNFDPTWSDETANGGGIYYVYYARNNAFFDSLSSHTVEPLWYGFLPEGTQEATVSGDWTPPSAWPQVTETVIAPVISVTEETGTYLVDITTETENATIYYTTDGTNPTVAAGKSTKYTGAFVLEEVEEIKAIAVRDTYWNSSVVGYTWEPSPEKPHKILNVVSGIHVYWTAVDSAEKYGLWRSETGINGEYKWIANPTVAHFTDTKVESGKTYYYKVTTLNAGVHSGKSEAIELTYVATPDISSRINKAAGVQLGWEAIEGATGYGIYRKSFDGNDEWMRIATIEDPSTLTYTDTSVKNKNGEVYRYTIRALAGSDRKTLSGCRNTGRTMVRLCSQTLSSAVKANANSIKCKWTTSKVVTGYEVRFMVGKNIYKTFTIGNYKTGVKTFANLPKGKEYKIQVRTYKKVEGVGSFYSAWSIAKNLNL